MSFGLMIEILVAALLMLTIGYCYTLNRRLERLRADEQSLKGTIAELITATEIAERAVGELKRAAYENDATLGERVRAGGIVDRHRHVHVVGRRVLIEPMDNPLLLLRERQR